MKLFIVLSVLVAIAICAPQSGYDQQQNEVSVVEYVNDNDGLGNYHFAYELTDGTKREETGELKDVGGEEPAVVMTGSYSFVAPDGIVYWVKFTADENGYHPVIGTGQS